MNEAGSNEAGRAEGGRVAAGGAGPSVHDSTWTDRWLAARTAEAGPDLGPMLLRIRTVMEQVVRQPVVQGDAECQLILRRMTAAEAMDAFEPLADALASRIAVLMAARRERRTVPLAEPGRARARPTRMLLKL